MSEIDLDDFKEKNFVEISIINAIFFTLCFKFLIQMSSFWYYFKGLFNTETLYIKYGIFINSFFELLFVVLIFYYLKLKHVFEFKRVSFWYYITAFLLGVVYVFSQKWLNYAHDYFFSTNYGDNTIYQFRDLKSKVSTNLIGMGIFIPLAEELFFRNFIQKGLEKKYSNKILSLVIVTCLFTLIHLPDYFLVYLVSFGVLISGVLYKVSKSVIPSIIFHIIWNLSVNLLSN